MAMVWSDNVCASLIEAGIVSPQARRVVIDLQAGHAAIIHVEQYGDERLLDVVRALEGVEVLASPGSVPEEIPDTPIAQDVAHRMNQSNRAHPNIS